MKPILFQPEMVQAILNGTKTQTRRAVKCYSGSESNPTRQTAKWQFENKTCPYGQPGDILWLRESYTDNGLGYYRYKADWGPGMLGTFINPSVPDKFRGKWKPSIHMPFAACRLFLKVKSVRVERLQDISEADAKAEGAKEAFCQYKNETSGYHSYVGGFIDVWCRINGPESWASNPWVWVIEFERTEKPLNVTLNS